jgi:hypothetical protein
MWEKKGEVLSQHLPMGTDENHERAQLERLMSQSKITPPKYKSKALLLEPTCLIKPPIKITTDVF